MGVDSNSARLLVDMVCDVCRVEGFAVEKNVEAEKNTGNTVDIVASRRHGNKTQKVAFECSERDSQASGREIENFAKRLKDLRISNGVYVSPKGFTGDAEYFARRLGVELWDLPKLREHLKRIETDDRINVPGTLPLVGSLPSTIFSQRLANAHALKIKSLPRLEFRPYYFAKFEIGSKKNRKGILVLDGVDGRVCDANMSEGHLKHLPSTGFFVECLDIEPQTGHMPNLPDELGMSNSVTVASAGIPQDQVRGLVGTFLAKEAGLDADNVSVTDVSLLHVPIVTVDLAAGARSYRKIVQGASGKIIWDESAKCLHCENPSRAICETCGTTVCDEHLRRCSSCQKHLCTDCVQTKGVVNKQALCPNCKKP